VIHKGLIIAAVAAILAAALYFAGHRDGADGVRKEWADQRRADIDQALIQSAAYRTRERELTDQLIEAQNALDSAIKQGNADRDSAIADLHADNLRLRERFRGCGTGGVPENSAPDGSDDGAGAGGLSVADQEFLLRVAAEADAVAHRLTACQHYIKSITN